jgi:hypothetical protein
VSDNRDRQSLQMNKKIIKILSNKKRYNAHMRSLRQRILKDIIYRDRALTYKSL